MFKKLKFSKMSITNWYCSMKNEIRNAKCETSLPKQSLNKSEWVSTSKSDERMRKTCSFLLLHRIKKNLQPMNLLILVHFFFQKTKISLSVLIRKVSKNSNWFFFSAFCVTSYKLKKVGILKLLCLKRAWMVLIFTKPLSSPCTTILL